MSMVHCTLYSCIRDRGFRLLFQASPRAASQEIISGLVVRPRLIGPFVVTTSGTPLSGAKRSCRASTKKRSLLWPFQNQLGDGEHSDHRARESDREDHDGSDLIPAGRGQIGASLWRGWIFWIASCKCCLALLTSVFAW